MFLRENQSCMYRADAYYAAKTLSDIPVYLIMPVAFVSISYYMIGLTVTPDCFFVYMGAAILVSNVGASFGNFD